MTFPKWNNEWEKPDPLRGKLGWGRRHYIALVVAAALLLTALAVMAPAVARARQRGAELDRAWKELAKAMAVGMSDTQSPR